MPRHVSPEAVPALAKRSAVVDPPMSVCVVLAVANGIADFDSPSVRVSRSKRKELFPVIRRRRCWQGLRGEGGRRLADVLPALGESLLRILLDSGREGLRGAGDRGCGRN